MKTLPTRIKDVYIIKSKIRTDKRGAFYKTYNENIFKEYNLCTEFKESYYSISKKDVIRGMHFQLPPFDHEKLVYVPKGKIIDVVLDMRKKSQTFGEYVDIELSEKNKLSIYIPKGCAHGFKSLEDNTITVYNVSTAYNPDYDSGVRWDSFGMDWEIDNPIVSNRDKGFKDFAEFRIPF
ncbi:dTDP-4-dehydrorhamnose 3,5-epimerase [Maledivibacter halophilus]|uniref:dTDP-4-dehydrorhamnose 3,5-epimerase n=1 Tax=Maledivibacter halophilus TaxID=36842 RepID=A0A1T5L3E6_9FIRM|nr:dTDP-4-dehydrorhamnose 3,5-epimerase [Maledivibacter halophilus]SKC69918.1 dTDP-4-dehydrorhamnose 3,5-epimerase [Maledivibacter halophilus]